MPLNTRQWARRELDRSIDGIDWTHTHLLRVVEKYVDLHPEIAAPLVLASDMLDEVQKLIVQTKQSF